MSFGITLSVDYVSTLWIANILCLMREILCRRKKHTEKRKNPHLLPEHHRGGWGFLKISEHPQLIPELLTLQHHVSHGVSGGPKLFGTPTHPMNKFQAQSIGQWPMSEKVSTLCFDLNK